MPIPKPRKGEEKNDFIGRCMSSDVMKREFPKSKQRSAVCFGEWRKKHKSQEATSMNQKVRAVQMTLQADPSLIRIEQFEERDFTVVPVIALIEGVLQAANVDGPELVLASEFANPAAAWNGQPITVGHPMVNGEFVAASSPQIFEDFAIGMIFAARLADKKLKVEAWLDNEKIDKLGGAANSALERINAGEEVEVSTGYFADSTPVNGVFNGEAYVAIQSDIKPNHLAILAEGTEGSCSWEDGCGAPRVNLQTEGTDVSLFNYLQKHYHRFQITGGTKTDRTFTVDNTKHGKESDKDKRFALSAALEEKGEGFFSVVAVYEDSFIYERNFQELLRRSFSIAEDGSITLGEETEQVRPVTEFITVKVNQEEEEEMKPEEEKKKEEVSATSEDEQKKKKEEEEAKLLAEKEEAEKASKAAQEEKEKQPEAVAAQRKEDGQPKNLEDFIANEVPPELRESILEGKRLLEEKRGGLIKGLVANEKCEFDQEELSALPIATLEKLHTLSGTADYSGQAGQLETNQEDPDAIPDAPQAFPQKQAN